MNEELLLGVTKVFYLFTIPWIWMIWYRIFQCRHTRPIVRTMFFVQSALAPLYTFFALAYVFTFQYHSWIGYLGWSAINTLFIATDGMLVNILTRDRDNG